MGSGVGSILKVECVLVCSQVSLDAFQFPKLLLSDALLACQRAGN